MLNSIFRLVIRTYHRSTTSRHLLSTGFALAVIVSLLAPWRQPSAYATLGTPTPMTPGDGTTTTASTDPPLGIPEFSWTGVTGATSYRLQFSQDIGFATKTETTTPNTSYTPTNAGQWSDGTWYWRVRADAPSPAGDYSSIMSFTKHWASDDNKPTLMSPDDGAALSFYNAPTFTWQPVPGGASYRLQIASTGTGFGTLLYNQTTLATSHQPTAKLSNGTYDWRVVPIDPSGRDGTPSDARTFMLSYNPAPTLLEPAQASNPTFTPTFRWTAMPGAQFYRLQYSTDDTFNTATTTVDTSNTTYTPVDTMPNDVDYYWRVRVHSGSSISDWSATRRFRKKWYIKPQLLTPTDLYQYVKSPVFSWTPVPGASYYRIEAATTNNFPPVTGWTETTANTFFVRPDFVNTDSYNWYWRVTPIDTDGKYGWPSDVFSFVYDPIAAAPTLVYPLYYYTPTTDLQPHEDRTVTAPLFMWNRYYDLFGVEASGYRVEVDDNPAFTSVNWTVDTHNVSAAPTVANPFTPTPGVIYYWRVRPLDGGGSPVGQWSQVWITRFDPSKGLTAKGTPTLLRPEHGFESVGISPLLEWWPLQGADSYQVQVSKDSTFASTDKDIAVPYPAYVPQDRLGYGTYYWRIRGRSGGVPFGSWSPTWRFQVAAQSQWRVSRTLGGASNRLPIASDSSGDTADANYDLTTLYAAQSEDYWFFGFNANVTTGTAVTYTLYLDLDHADYSGATNDPLGFDVVTIPAHRPEYAIYVVQNGGAFSAGNVVIEHWNGNAGAWDQSTYPKRLSDIGGGLYYSSTINYVEIRVPNTAIGMEERTSSAAVSLFSATSAGDRPRDAVPTDSDVGTTGILSRFTSVSERMNLAMPPSNATGDPTVFPSILPFFWDFPGDTPWEGFNLQVDTDAGFTSSTKAAEYTVTSSGGPYWAPPFVSNDQDFQGDNTYFWRVRPVYNANQDIKGAWSQPGRIERKGFVPENLQTSVAFATPTFSWDMVEGAQSYDLRVDDSPNFATPIISVDGLARNLYTPTDTLNKGTYYWRVVAHRYSGITNEWSYSQTFTLALPQPDGLTQEPGGVVGRAPTLCWNSLSVSNGGVSVLTAWKYRVEISKGNSTFSPLYDSIETEQNCWTPTKGYDDGTYYWHVAMIDGDGKRGDFSPAAQFTKQYPTTTLLVPTSGSAGTQTPTFVWSEVNGAASYKIEVSVYANFAQIYDSASTNNTRYTPTKTYDLNKTYYWRVAMVDKDGKVGPFNNATIILDPKGSLPFRMYLPWSVRNYAK